MSLAVDLDDVDRERFEGGERVQQLVAGAPAVVRVSGGTGMRDEVVDDDLRTGILDHQGIVHAGDRAASGSAMSIGSAPAVSQKRGARSIRCTSRSSKSPPTRSPIPGTATSRSGGATWPAAERPLEREVREIAVERGISDLGKEEACGDWPRP